MEKNKTNYSESDKAMGDKAIKRRALVIETYDNCFKWCNKKALMGDSDEVDQAYENAAFIAKSKVDSLDYKVGDTVSYISHGWLGKIIKIDDYLFTVDFGDKNGKYCLCYNEIETVEASEKRRARAVARKERERKINEVLRTRWGRKNIKNMCDFE